MERLLSEVILAVLFGASIQSVNQVVAKFRNEVCCGHLLFCSMCQTFQKHEKTGRNGLYGAFALTDRFSRFVEPRVFESDPKFGGNKDT